MQSLSTLKWKIFSNNDCLIKQAFYLIFCEQYSCFIRVMDSKNWSWLAYMGNYRINFLDKFCYFSVDGSSRSCRSSICCFCRKLEYENSKYYIKNTDVYGWRCNMVFAVFRHAFPFHFSFFINFTRFIKCMLSSSKTSFCVCSCSQKFVIQCCWSKFSFF